MTEPPSDPTLLFPEPGADPSESSHSVESAHSSTFVPLPGHFSPALSDLYGLPVENFVKMDRLTLQKAFTNFLKPNQAASHPQSVKSDLFITSGLAFYCPVNQSAPRSHPELPFSRPSQYLAQKVLSATFFDITTVKNSKYDRLIEHFKMTPHSQSGRCIFFKLNFGADVTLRDIEDTPMDILQLVAATLGVFYNKVLNFHSHDTILQTCAELKNCCRIQHTPNYEASFLIGKFLNAMYTKTEKNPATFLTFIFDRYFSAGFSASDFTEVFSFEFKTSSPRGTLPKRLILELTRFDERVLSCLSRCRRFLSEFRAFAEVDLEALVVDEIKHNFLRMWNSYLSMWDIKKWYQKEFVIFFIAKVSKEARRFKWSLPQLRRAVQQLFAEVQKNGHTPIDIRLSVHSMSPSQLSCEALD